MARQKIDEGGDITATNDGNFLMVGSSNDTDTGYDNISLLKIDPTGALIWAKSYGGERTEIGTRIVPLESGGYIISGKHYLSGPEVTDMMYFKIDEEGYPL